MRFWKSRVGLQMMRRQIIALLLLVQLLGIFLAALPARAESIGSLAGQVFVDANANGRRDPGEAKVAGATVFVVAMADASTSRKIVTDAQGYFLLTGLDYGQYSIWADAEGKQPHGATTVEIAEVNATVLIDLPLYAPYSIDKTVEAGRLFLPLLKP
jgi:hypothetical protein